MKRRNARQKKFRKDGKSRHVKNLGRKTRRKIEKHGKIGIDINKIKNGKNKLLFKVFNKFKLSYSFYKDYP